MTSQSVVSLRVEVALNTNLVEKHGFSTPLRRPMRSSPTLATYTVWRQGRYNSPAMSRARSLSTQRPIKLL